MAKQLKVVGCDPSLRNWGLAAGLYDLSSKNLTIVRLGLVQPNLPTGKQVRQNSLDLESAQQLFKGSIDTLKEADAVFVEVPVGSQSARAMASYGICVGVLGSLRGSGIPFFEVTPSEVKVATGLQKDASKKQMIAWAMQKHPEANWPRYNAKGGALISEAKAEHQADAIAAIYAGLSCSSFQQLLPLLAVKP